MKTSEPLSTLQEVKIAWINLADNYKSAEENEIAHELLKELVFRSENKSDIPTLKKRYLQHLQEWDHMKGSLKKGTPIAKPIIGV